MDLTQIFINRPDILNDPKKLKSTFSDFYTGDIGKINRMMKAYEVGALEALVKGDDHNLENKKIIDRLVMQHDMLPARASEAVTEWERICSEEVLERYKKYLSKIAAEKAREKETNQEDQEEKKELQEDIATVEEAEILNVDHEDYGRYLNLDLSSGSIVRGIPCGVGNGDYGFIVKGTGQEDLNNQEAFPSVHALVYNFLIRDSHITKDDYPQYMKNNASSYELDYAHVYRFMMILLDLLKPSGKTELRLKVLGNKDEIKAAADILNEYLAIFGRLTRTDICSVSIINDSKGKSISVEKKADYYVENFTSDQGLRRRIRYGARINYKLDKSDRKDLEFLLREISPFTSFKKGQFDALISMMNANGHAVCIMPTGSGKSLIYYLACLLQPQVAFIVSPTDILIKDQIRNLRIFHKFDNVSHIDLRSENDFSFFKPGANLLFLTPSTFQNMNLFKSFMRWKKEISYVVLDEIHCLSNWGHDFRPEYLMLSKNMSKYLDDARYLGFTATANYTVVQDIQKQLNIPIENFFSPVLFEKYNVRYDFREKNTTEEMLDEVRLIANDIINRNQRALVFTKSDEISEMVADAIGYEADIFTSTNSEAYVQFAEGLCQILVASQELGIGINLPDVNCTIHFGIPVSKNEFVQEIGRAGREEGRVTSYVIYLNPTEDNIPERLLKRETVIDNLPQVLNEMNNDYADAYHKLNCGADTSDILFDRLMDIYSDFHIGNKPVYRIDCPTKGIETYKQLIYMLYVTGFVKDWYVSRAIDNNESIELMIDICSIPGFTGHDIAMMEDDKMLERMRGQSRNYFASMGNDRESIFKVTRAKKIEEVLRVYVNWYYEKFLYHHKEEFLDCFEFITSNAECDSLKITEEIEGYFTLPFIQIKEDEEYYGNMTLDEISHQVMTGIGKNTLSNLERINSNNYSYKLDYLLFIGNWSRTGRFEENRLERFWGKLSTEEKQQFMSAMENVYFNCSDEAKWTYLTYLDGKSNITGLKLNQVMNGIYQKSPKDKFFYGIMAKEINDKFNKFVRR